MSLLWPNYIHPDLPLTKQERKVIRRKAWKLWQANRWNLALHLLVCVIGFLVMLNAADGGDVAGHRGIPAYAVSSGIVAARDTHCRRFRPCRAWALSLRSLRLSSDPSAGARSLHQMRILAQGTGRRKSPLPRVWDGV